MDTDARERYERLEAALASERRRGRWWAAALLFVTACALLPDAPGSRRAQQVVLLEDGEERGVLDADLRLKTPGEREVWLSTDRFTGVGALLRAGPAVATFQTGMASVHDSVLFASERSETFLRLAAAGPAAVERDVAHLKWDGVATGYHTYTVPGTKARTPEEHYFTDPFFHE